jgi:hypothetical protein
MGGVRKLPCLSPLLLAIVAGNALAVTPIVSQSSISRNITATASVVGYAAPTQQGVYTLVSGTNCSFNGGGSMSSNPNWSDPNLRPWNRYWVSSITISVGGTPVASWSAPQTPGPTGEQWLIRWASNHFSHNSTVTISVTANFVVQRVHSVAVPPPNPPQYVVDETATIGPVTSTVDIKAYNKLEAFRCEKTSAGGDWPAQDKANIDALVSAGNNAFAAANYAGVANFVQDKPAITGDGTGALNSSSAVFANCHGTPDGILSSNGYFDNGVPTVNDWMPWDNISGAAAHSPVKSSWAIVYACDTLSSESSPAPSSFNLMSVDACYLGFTRDLEACAWDNDNQVKVSFQEHAQYLLEELVAGHTAFDAIQDANDKYTPLSNEDPPA